MANRHRGEVSVMLGGAEITLRPSFEAIVEIEETVGLLPILAAQACEMRLPAKSVFAVIRAGAKAAGADVKPSVIPDDGLSAANLAAFKFLHAALTGGSDEPGEAPATNGTAGSPFVECSEPQPAS